MATYVKIGMPEAVARVTAAFDTSFRLGEASKVSQEVEKCTGRKPKSFREFLAENGF